jgi:hypothetical protein
MTKLTTISLAAFGGMTVLVLAGSAYAAVDRTTFQASPNELRRYCERIDQNFWRAKRTYGCGDKVGCASGNCRIYKEPPPPPPPRYPPPRFLTRDGGGNGGDGGKEGGSHDNGGGAQGGANSAAGSHN